jgi:hypothetical protein
LNWAKALNLEEKRSAPRIARRIGSSGRCALSGRTGTQQQGTKHVRASEQSSWGNGRRYQLTAPFPLTRYAWLYMQPQQ